MPIAAVILLLLFVIQRYGTAAVGRAFGPVMLLWFLTIAILGGIGIAKAPHVIVAVNPLYAAAFLIHHGIASLAILGAVFLCVTGAEAMYADMGHLGREPIRIAWTAIVLPALLLNYAGQTAVVLQNSGGDANPFFVLAPAWLLYPMVVLSTLATVIASQAIITGSFSLTRQAMQLGWLPGMHIKQTSSEQYGQIYVPFVNWLMMLGTLALTVIFAQFGPACRRLWRGGVHHHADDHGDPLSHHAGVVAVAGMGGDRRVRALHDRRYRILRGQYAEDRRGRLDTAGRRRASFHRHDDLARRHGCDASHARARRR